MDGPPTYTPPEPDPRCDLAPPADLMDIWLACDEADGDTDVLVAEFGAVYGASAEGE